MSGAPLYRLASRRLRDRYRYVRLACCRVWSRVAACCRVRTCGRHSDRDASLIGGLRGVGSFSRRDCGLLHSLQGYQAHARAAHQRPVCWACLSRGKNYVADTHTEILRERKRGRERERFSPSPRMNVPLTHSLTHSLFRFSTSIRCCAVLFTVLARWPISGCLPQRANLRFPQYESQCVPAGTYVRVCYDPASGKQRRVS